MSYKELEAKSEARAAVGEVHGMAAALRKGGDQELADEIEVWAKVHNDPSVEEMESAASGGKKTVAKLEALRRHEEAEALGELVAKLEEAAVAAQEVKETKAVLKGEHAALDAVQDVLLEAQKVCASLEAAGLVVDAVVVHELEQLLAGGEADPEVLARPGGGADREVLARSGGVDA